MGVSERRKEEDVRKRRQNKMRMREGRTGWQWTAVAGQFKTGKDEALWQFSVGNPPSSLPTWSGKPPHMVPSEELS